MDKKKLTEQFDNLAERENNPFKKRAYIKAGQIIAEMSEEEFVQRDNFMDIKGIGDAINNKILHFKQTGFIKKEMASAI
jgi:DNA polymerase/3'-5' exonuclease PolX